MKRILPYTALLAVAGVAWILSNGWLTPHGLEPDSPLEIETRATVHEPQFRPTSQPPITPSTETDKPEPPHPTNQERKPIERKSDAPPEVEPIEWETPEAIKSDQPLVWTVVDGYGRGLPDFRGTLVVRFQGEPYEIPMHAQAHGRVHVPAAFRSAGCIFLGLRPDNRKDYVEVPGQYEREALLDRAIVRLLPKAHVTFALTKNQAPSETPFALGLFRDTDRVPFVAQTSNNRSTELWVPGGNYRLAILTPRAPWMELRSSPLPLLQNLRPGTIANFQLEEPDRRERTVRISPIEPFDSRFDDNVESEGLSLEAVGLPSHRDPRFTWTPENPLAFKIIDGYARNATPFYARSIPTFLQDSSGSKFFRINKKDVELWTAPAKQIALGPYAGIGVESVAHSYVDNSSWIPGSDIRWADGKRDESTLQVRAPDWLSLSSHYQEGSWKRASIDFYVGAKGVNLEKQVRLATLQVPGDVSFRRTLARGPDLRWTMEVPLGTSITRVTADLHFTGVEPLFLPYPYKQKTKRKARSRFQTQARERGSALGWAHQTEPGHVGIGTIPINPRRLHLEPEFPLRVYNLRCHGEDGKAAPYAQVTLRTGDEVVRGVSDKRGRLKVFAFQTQPIWIDGGWLPRPGQVFLPVDHPQDSPISLLVPTTPNSLTVDVIGKQPYNALIIKILTLRFMDAERDSPLWKLGPLLEETFPASGQLHCQGLAPGEYMAVLESTNSSKAIQTKQFSINASSPTPKLRFQVN